MSEPRRLSNPPEGEREEGEEREEEVEEERERRGRKRRKRRGRGEGRGGRGEEDGWKRECNKGSPCRAFLKKFESHSPSSKIVF